MTANWADLFRAAAERAAAVLERKGVRWQVGAWRDAVFLKLQKANWTNDAAAADPVGTGVFFSIWVDESGLKKNRVSYNLHALKLRAWPGYSIESRKFAEAFRNEFTVLQSDWPNVSTEYGPQNLMQGWVTDKEDCAEKLDQLIARFFDLTGTIDKLLLERRGTARSRAQTK